jgi:hypothetical protein
MRLADATYLLPIRMSAPPPAELTEYLRSLSQLCPIVVVDASPEDVFAAAHEQWHSYLAHLHVDPNIHCANGKVRGVRTGLRHVRTPVVVIADDDIRYTERSLAACLHALDEDDAALVRPQNYFEPLPWHAVWDTGRILLNRLAAADFPGTLVLRMEALRSSGGAYDGDVLFENLELIRTITAGGGACRSRPDITVLRRPPTTSHFVHQRVRQAYDELARPHVLAWQLAILPMTLRWLTRRQHARLLAAALATGAAAEIGRRRDGGRAHFPFRASLCAPGWLLERGVCAWCAIVLRVLGGVRYSGSRISRAAHSTRSLRAVLTGGAFNVSGSG